MMKKKDVKNKKEYGSKNKKKDRDNKKVKNKNTKGNKKFKNNKNSTFNLTEVIIIVILAILFGGVVGALIAIGNQKMDAHLEEFYTTYQDITTEYYKKVDKTKLVEAAIEGMVDYLGDPYSTYMDNDETETFNQTVDGEYKGIGVTVSIVDEKPVVVSMFDSSPAKKAGVKVGDIIVKVNDESTAGKSLDQVVLMIKKESNVRLTVSRDGKEKTYEIALTDVMIPSVSSKVISKDDKKIGVISVSVFAANTYQQFLDKLNSLEKKKMDSLIIDVRDNPGGHLSQVTEILSLFLDKSKILYQIDSNGKKTKVYSSTNDKKTYPVAVLINEGSASASEILAGAMKESYKAVIVGKKSYGKGTVQKEYSLSSGSSIKFTTERWLTPKGNSINKKGISPDVSVDLGDEYQDDPRDENDKQLQTAIDELVKKMNKKKDN